ncbi:uncharacterized protein [Rutidosis leptorrhynchoides]|uniref:uncharacterized protein n=1 Tax=Rutidosis leptorrhynchoides TaxID=125765 RepID=UPI003A993411
MALGSCLQLSIVGGTARAQYYQIQPVQYKEKLNNIQSIKGLTTNKSSIVSFSASFGLSLATTRSQKPRIVCKAKEAVDAVKEVTDKAWESQVIGNENPVLVEFWAPWCGPCRMIAPVIDELAKEYAGKIACFKVNTDDCPNIATQYGIRSIPTVLFFKNGEKKESVIGAVPKTTLSSTIDKYLE